MPFLHLCFFLWYDSYKTLRPEFSLLGSLLVTEQYSGVCSKHSVFPEVPKASAGSSPMLTEQHYLVLIASSGCSNRNVNLNLYGFHHCSTLRSLHPSLCHSSITLMDPPDTYQYLTLSLIDSAITQ